MNCRRAMLSDYDEIASWWEAHGWSAVPKDILPYGWIVEEGGKRLCAGFLYIAGNAPVGYLEYLVSNPSNTQKESFKSIDFVLEEILKFAKYSLIQCLFCRIVEKSKGLEKMYARHGFKTGDVVRDMIWRL